jgi:hypothetical protein
LVFGLEEELKAMSQANESLNKKNKLNGRQVITFDFIIYKPN